MTALTADRDTEYREGILQQFPVKASTKIYAGSLVCVEGSSGYAEPAANTSGLQFVGVATETVDNSSGSNGDLWITVRRKGIFRLNASSITQAMVGDIMYAIDDQTFDETGSNGVVVGRLVRYVSATEGWIDIGEGVYPSAVAAAGSVSVADAGSLFSIDTVEAALAQLGTRLQKARITPIALTLEDGTALTAYTADPTPGWAQLSNKEVVLKWGSHATPGKIAAVFTLPDDLDGSANVEVHALVAMSGATDTPDLVHEAYFNAGDTDCAGTDDEVDGGVTLTEYVNVIAASDVPNGPAHLTCVINPKDGQLGTDDLYLYAIWVEYTRVIT
jgi:hypothetical protein